MTAIPFGACHCGCGGPTNLTTQNDTTRGYVKGEPRLYIRGHHSRGKIKGTPEERFWPKIEKNTYIRRSGGRYCRACGAASHRRRKRALRLERAS